MPLKIIIFSARIYPAISPRSFRATELAKALSKLGHNVTLFGILGDYDYSSFSETTGVVVKDLGKSYFSYHNSDGKIKIPFWKKVFIASLSRLLEFPYILYLNKVKAKLLNEGNVDLVISIAIPYPIHWSIARIKKSEKNFKLWISDCGDPFMGNTFRKPPFYFKPIEKWWARKTDFITVPFEGAKNAYYNEFRDKIKIIPQGFSFENVNLPTYKTKKSITFIYAGLFYPEKRDPTNFLKYLINLNIDFKFIIYTSNAKILLKYKSILGNKLIINESIERSLLLKELAKADFIINFKNKGSSAQIPSKLIDYTFSKRPIINLTSEFDEEEKTIFNQFLNKNYSNQFKLKNFDKYNSLNVAKEFIKLYDLKDE
jgi:hypothetical protein